MEGQPRSALTSRVERLSDRVEDHEQRLDRLQNTLKAIAEEANGISIGGPCNKCNKSFMLLQNGQMYCPNCGDGQSI